MQKKTRTLIFIILLFVILFLLIGSCTYLFSTAHATNTCARNFLGCISQTAELGLWDKTTQGLSCLLDNIVCVFYQVF